MGGISIWQLLIVLVIALVIFGTKKLRSAGGDLGAAIRNFKTSMKDGEGKDAEGKDGEKSAAGEDSAGGRVIEGEVTSRDKEKV